MHLSDFPADVSSEGVGGELMISAARVPVLQPTCQNFELVFSLLAHTISNLF